MSLERKNSCGAGDIDPGVAAMRGLALLVCRIFGAELLAARDAGADWCRAAMISGKVPRLKPILLAGVFSLD